MHIIFQLTGAPIIEFAYYITLSIALPLISASIAVGTTMFNIEDTSIGDLRRRSIPHWMEFAKWDLRDSVHHAPRIQCVLVHRRYASNDAYATKIRGAPES